MKFRAPQVKRSEFHLRPSEVVATLRSLVPPDCGFGVRGFLENALESDILPLNSDYSHLCRLPVPLADTPICTISTFTCNVCSPPQKRRTCSGDSAQITGTPSAPNSKYLNVPAPSAVSPDATSPAASTQ